MSGAQAQRPAECVVLVHGLWMPGWDLALLARRLQQAGFQTHIYRYHSVRARPEDNARGLGHYLAGLDAEVLHLVGHSLGGLVIRHLLAQSPQALAPGRVVTLGTPHQGSRRAAGLWERNWTRPLLGESFESALSGRLPPWTASRELGSVAGSLSLGFSALFGELEAPDDGVVSVAETRLAGARDHVVLHVSHTGLVFSAEVAQQTVRFLRTGAFSHPAAA